MRYRQAAVEIGDPDGKICVWLNESSANDLAYHFHEADGFRRDLFAAIETAYPRPTPDDLQAKLDDDQIEAARLR